MKSLCFFSLMVIASFCVGESIQTISKVSEQRCEATLVSPQLDECIRLRVETSNTNLTNEVKNLEKRIQNTYRQDPNLGKKLTKKIHYVQDAWSVFRNLNCNMEAFEIETGTSAFITSVNYCTTRMNEERIDILAKMMN